MPQVGTSHPTATICNGPQGISRRLIRSNLPHNPAGVLAENYCCLATGPTYRAGTPSFIRKKVLTMNEEWSNNACCGYVIKAMENCGFKPKDIRQVLTELYEVFDFCAVEEAAHYYENWQS